VRGAQGYTLSVMRLRHWVIPLLTLAFSNCTLVSGKCSYEVRSLQAAGRIDDGGSELVSGELGLTEQRDLNPNKYMYWLLTGPPLKGHVLSAAFKDASNPSVVLLNLPIADATRTSLSEGGAEERAGANLDGFFELISEGRGVFELQTDQPSRPTITLPVTTTQREDWVRPNC
jgi:hypothetical protein